jgi:hypothetical protein
MSERPTDVVLLCASGDDKTAAELAGRLRKEGVEAWFVSSGLRAEEDWRGKLNEALDGSRVCAVLLGKGGRLSDPGVRVVERRVAAGADLRVIVVLLPETQWSMPSEAAQEKRRDPAEGNSARQAPQKDGKTEPARPEGPPP